MILSRRPARAAAAAGLAAGLLVALWYVFLRETGDPRLAPFVRAPAACSVVFTSRTEPASFRAAAAVGDYTPAGPGARGSGQPQWQAREGRLRVLTSRGNVRELTWDKPLPDGGKLVDVMSPSVGPDGWTVVFAGRRADRHGGRFRIYAVNLDGSDLRPLTGTENDTGCATVPPLRFNESGDRLPDAERRALDFDDVDPVLVTPVVLVFASSRTPDTGGRDRRATQLWVREGDQPPRSLTASRANDRWPAAQDGRVVTFSVWSKQDEVVSADGRGLTRDPGGRTAPADRWFGASLTATGEAFAHVAKLPNPVWRPRVTADGSVVYMTTPPGGPTPFTPANEYPEAGVLAVARAKVGTAASAPSSLAAGEELPPPAGPVQAWLNPTDADARTLSAATPSVFPGGVLVSAAPVGPAGRPEPGAYAVCVTAAAEWPTDPALPGPTATVLFDDPDMVDAEPVAVFERKADAAPLRLPSAWPAETDVSITLAGGTTYRGPAGKVEAHQLTDPAADALLPPFARGSIKAVAFYAAHRDRYDDPKRVIVPGGLEKLLEVRTLDRGSGAFEATLPVGSPTLLVGLGADGKVVSAPVPGRTGTYYAYAGDHVSGVRAGGYHFCTGCHTGHTAQR